MTTAPAPALAPLAARWRDEFPIFRHSIYLNSCSLGALSRRGRERVNEYLDLWEHRGASAWYDVWWAALAELRTRYGQVVGAAPGAIALHPNISGALAVVGSALDYARRPKVVVTSLDFPTISYQWLAKLPHGVEVEVLESPDATTVPLELYERAIDDRTALVATSHVFYNSGAIQDVRAIAELAHRRGALCLVDGYQAAGQLPVDVQALGVDFYCSGGLKWLLGGTGVAFLYVAPHLHGALVPEVTGWFSQREQFRFDNRRLEFAEDARRFEAGTPPLMPVYAQLGGLDVLQAIGFEEIRRQTQALAEDLIARATEAGLKPKVAPTPAERTAIVMLPSADPHRDVARLAEAHFVVDARPGHVRVSPYFYNTVDDHRALVEFLIRG
ncbi:MAG TPA: aminotransferase class V-fold PLP-dependent enzyme [Gemmatimonadales bacterium]|nr:aminotransferase class V-fold PLP-dependent enzyme [Gemmatimonadales bacterium]